MTAGSPLLAFRHALQSTQQTTHSTCTPFTKENWKRFPVHSAEGPSIIACYTETVDGPQLRHVIFGTIKLVSWLNVNIEQVWKRSAIAATWMMNNGGQGTKSSLSKATASGSVDLRHLWKMMDITTLSSEICAFFSAATRPANLRYYKRQLVVEKSMSWPRPARLQPGKSSLAVAYAMQVPNLSIRHDW